MTDATVRARIPSFEHRRAVGRPVLTKLEMTRLTEQILSMTSADTVSVRVTHTAQVITRLANDRVLSTDDGDILRISIATRYGARAGVWVITNQVSETTLRALVERCEAMARAQIGGEKLLDTPQVQDDYLPVALWHDTTVQAMSTSRETVVPAIIGQVTQQGLRAAGFVGLMARAQAVLTKQGITAFCDETDSEVTVTARTSDGSGSGWAGHAARDWSAVSVGKVADEAVHIARLSQRPQAFEPGRRTAILGPAAVVQMLRYLAQELDAGRTDMGATGFSDPDRRGSNRIGQRVFDPLVTLRSDPADLEGGYRNYFETGFANPRMTWVEQGVLKNLAYSVEYAVQKGKPYAERPYSLRMAGGSSSLDAMVAQCQEGIYVNRLSSVELLDLRSGLMTGVTRDGCFLVKDGKIDRPVKNFRFLESPFSFLNQLIALGPTARATFGYTPPGPYENYTYGISTEFSWPRRPMIVPPMMVRDFNFNMLADAI